MALKRNERYTGRFANPSTAHPQGAFQNRSSPTSQDGSYLEADWANDWDGFFGSLLSAASVTPNGNVDGVGSSQYFTALQALFFKVASNLSEIATAGATAQAAARGNLGLGTAATRDVGTAINQVPDMSFFSSLSGSIGYSKLPNGIILQYGFANTSSGGVATITMPIAFSTSNYRVVGAAVDQAVPNILATASNTANTFSASGWGANNTNLLGVRQGTSFNWVAMGY